MWWSYGLSWKSRHVLQGYTGCCDGPAVRFEIDLRTRRLSFHEQEPAGEPPAAE